MCYSALFEEEKAFGPKKFKNLIANISTITMEYAILKIKRKEVDIVFKMILVHKNQTYFKKLLKSKYEL